MIDPYSRIQFSTGYEGRPECKCGGGIVENKEFHAVAQKADEARLRLDIYCDQEGIEIPEQMDICPRCHGEGYVLTLREVKLFERLARMSRRIEALEKAISIAKPEV